MSTASRHTRSLLPDGLAGIARDGRDGVLGGVAAGIAARVGVDPLAIRLAFALTTLAGGVGAVVYLAAWLVLPERPEGVEPREDVQPNALRAAGVGCVTLGILIVMRDLGLWFGDALVAPLLLAATGSAAIWLRSDDAERRRLGSLVSDAPGRPLTDFGRGPLAFARIAVGGIAVLGGLAVFVAAADATTDGPRLLFAVIATGIGAVLVAGPWVLRLAGRLTDERRRRIRSEERAEVAAHLHDSVLQTLTLIQRSDAPPDVVRLARAQERDLRGWLAGRDLSAEPTTVDAALEAVAAEVEDRWGVAVEVVAVGSAPLDDRSSAMVSAAAEAMANAARHSGSGTVQVYCEVEDGQVVVSVRDEGRGFDPDRVAADRRGIEESIIGRMTRRGGHALVESAPGEGTEITLTMPRRPT